MEQKDFDEMAKAVRALGDENATKVCDWAEKAGKANAVLVKRVRFLENLVGQTVAGSQNYSLAFRE
jgi:hypothetical protein